MRQPKKPPSLAKILTTENKQDPEILFRAGKPEIRALVERANDNAWNFEDCGYRAPTVGLTPNQLWLFVKVSRLSDRRDVPLLDKNSRPFTYRLPPESQRILHRIDTNLGGTIESSFPQIESHEDRQRYLITSLTEEAIASSQIEGAAVTREAAKEMLRSQRPPRDAHERMILNNYQTIRMLNHRRIESLTPELLLEIQRQLTEGTMEKPDAAGRFRRASEDIYVWDDEDGERLHTPPAAEELSKRIDALCAFANADGSKDGSTFIHPSVRAIILHFWLGFDHPFCDGNGRTARALFYWSMLRSGYWLVEYLTISSIIRGQRKEYARAYLNTEVDDNDLTYFIMYHLQVIDRSINEFRAYLDRKLSERKRLAAVIVPAIFNPRQQAILRKALRDPAAVFSYESHAASSGISLATARADLLNLEKRKLLRGNRVGRRFEFITETGLEDRLRKLATRSERSG